MDTYQQRGWGSQRYLKTRAERDGGQTKTQTGGSPTLIGRRSLLSQLAALYAFLSNNRGTYWYYFSLKLWPCVKHRACRVRGDGLRVTDMHAIAHNVADCSTNEVVMCVFVGAFCCIIVVMGTKTAIPNLGIYSRWGLYSREWTGQWYVTFEEMRKRQRQAAHKRIAQKHWLSST